MALTIPSFNLLTNSPSDTLESYIIPSSQTRDWRERKWESVNDNVIHLLGEPGDMVLPGVRSAMVRSDWGDD